MRLRNVDPGAASDDRHRLEAGDRSDEHRRRRRVADTEIARDKQVGARIDLLVGDTAPGGDSGERLFLGERVLAVERAAGAADLVAAGVFGGRSGDGHVGDLYRCAVLACENRNPGAAGEYIFDHLRGDLGREGRHPVGGNTVIAGEDDDGCVRQRRWRNLAAARRVPDGEVFEPAERTGGLREHCLVVESLTRDVPIGLGDLAELARSFV